MGVWVNVGARDESPEEGGLSHFIEHMIFKGTTRRNAFQIAKEFDAIGGQTNAFTAAETTCYHARVLDSHIDTMVDILSDIFLNSTFDPDEMERERLVITQEIEMVEDSPEEFIHVLSENAHWGDHPLGRPISGSRANVLGFTSRSLVDFFHRFYQPDRIIISAAGNLDHDRLVAMMSPAFEKVRPGNGFPVRKAPVGKTGVFLNPKDLGQVQICLATKGLPITDNRRFAAALMNTLLGGNMSSRLFQEIRERRGLAYSVYSFVSSYVDNGMTGIYVATHPDQAAACVELILRELDRLKSETVDPAELSDAKEFTRAGLLMAAESVDSQMVRLAQSEIHFGKYIPTDTLLKKVSAVTADEIQSLARDVFRRTPMTLTLLGPVADPAPFEALLGNR